MIGRILLPVSAMAVLLKVWANDYVVSQATCDKIPGGKHQAMKGLGHFPATENPKVFVGYLLEAIDHIQKTRA